MLKSVKQCRVEEQQEESRAAFKEKGVFCSREGQDSRGFGE